MEILTFDFDLYHGFAWITVAGRDQKALTIQCCLKYTPNISENCDNDGEYSKTIVCGDCGHDWGICGDVNGEAFDYWGENRCMTALFKKAIENGITCKGL